MTLPAAAAAGDDERVDLEVVLPAPAWQPIPAEAYETYWTPFERRFAFRPSLDPGGWPAITEPFPAVTVDLAPVFRDEGPGRFGAAQGAVNALGLLAMTGAFPDETRLVALDWQHASYHFWPHRQAGQDDPQWPIGVFPNGDYHAFLAEDLTTGTFGHPWEQTLCVFGAPLVEALVPLLTSWLPIKRSNP
jgi:hypothetical protein